MHALGMVDILVNTNLKLNDFTRRLRTPSCFMGAIIGPASGINRGYLTVFPKYHVLCYLSEAGGYIVTGTG